MRSVRFFGVVMSLAVVLAGCSPDDPEPQSSGSPTVSAPASVTPSVSPSATATAKPTAKPTTAKPTPKPTPTVSKTPTPTPAPTPPKPTTPPGTVMTTKGAYLQLSEDENLTTPDPENGCEVHDPDLTQVSCGVVTMAGGIATWVAGYEKNTLPGESEPRRTVRIYRRLANGTDSMVYVGFGKPGTWGDTEARVGSLTGQANDSLVVIVTMRGSGTYAGFDVLTWRAGAPAPKLRAHWPEGSHAQIYVRSRGYISMYVADYSDGAPNCCPTSWQHYNAYHDGTSFRLRKFSNVKEPPAS